MPTKKNITIEKVYKMAVDLQRDMALMKKSIMEEPDLRDEFISRMKDIDLEKTVMVKDFSERYVLK